MIPQEIMNDKHIKKYALYDQEGFIVEKAMRQPTSKDVEALVTPEGVIAQPIYYGDWVYAPQDEIILFNDALRTKRKTSRMALGIAIEQFVDRAHYEESALPNDSDHIMYTPVGPRTSKAQQELEEALALLNKMREQRRKEIGDNRRYEG